MDSFLAVIRALSDRDRVRIIKLLQFASLDATALGQILDRSEADIGDHLAVLCESRLVSAPGEDQDEVFRVNADRSNLYGAVILALLDGWLNDDGDVQEDRRRAEPFL